ncbi:hypothetical protein BHE74_00020502, partial [Ensete ventricosum]
IHSSQISNIGGTNFLLQSAGGCRAIVSCAGCSFPMRKVMAIDGLWVVPTSEEVVDTAKAVLKSP